VTIAGAVIALGALTFFVGRWALRGAFASAKPTGAPTPKEAEIQTQGQAEIERINADAARDKQEIENASDDALLALARERMFPKK